MLQNEREVGGGRGRAITIERERKKKKKGSGGSVGIRILPHLLRRGTRPRRPPERVQQAQLLEPVPLLSEAQPKPSPSQPFPSPSCWPCVGAARWSSFVAAKFAAAPRKGTTRKL